MAKQIWLSLFDQFHPNDFSRVESEHLPCQLQLFIIGMHGDERFGRALLSFSLCLLQKKNTNMIVSVQT
jgi:hypothetical protein